MDLSSSFKKRLISLKAKAGETLSKISPRLSFNTEVKESIIVNKIDVRPINRGSADVARWRAALLAAEGMGQYRAQLYDIYSEALLDGFLSAVVNKRIVKVTNKKYIFSRNGVQDDKINAILEKQFFADFLTHVIESKFWGHSLVELMWRNDATGQTVLIPRKHVKPRFKIVTQNQHDTQGYSYAEKPLSEYVIEIGNSEDLGLLNKICPLVLWKRADMGDWAEFAETFGMPTIFGKYNNEQTRSVLIEALDAMGSRGRAVMPNDAVIEYHEATHNTKGEVFEFFKATLNEEISITILGNSMTTLESKSGGYAQSKTHGSEQDGLHSDDCMFVLRVLNEKLIPFLQKIGYNTEGGTFAIEDSDNMSLTDRINIDVQLKEIVEIDPSYWYEKYKIPKPKTPIDPIKKKT
jgi:hypothetical protein